MANHKSAIKRTRQDARKKVKNRRNRGRLRTAVKALRAAIAAGNNEVAQSLLPGTISIIDKSIQKGSLHRNAAARHKSRLTEKVTAMAR
jgi:small subunit ribosomal protein S20